jgi:hypothetical protein
MANIVNENKNLGLDKMNHFYRKKDECFQSIRDADVYVSKDIIPNDASKEFSGMSWDDLLTYTEENNNLYEIIKEDRPRYSYFDIDATYQKVKHSLKDGEDFGKKITENLKTMIEDFKADNGLDENCDLVVLEACTKNKFSYHFIDRSISFNNKDDCKIYHEKFLDHLYDTNQTLLTSVIDKVVYDKDRNFRLINQSKMKDGAVSLTLTSDHTHEDTFITKVDNATRYDIPKHWLRKKRKEFIAPIVENLEENEFEELLMIVDKLKDERFVEYDLWLKTVWDLYACGLPADEIHYISENRCPEKYDYSYTENVMKQYEHEKSKFNIETLKSWAKSDSGFEIERVVERVKKEQPKKKEEHYQFLNLLKEYDGRTFPLSSGLNDFIKQASSCVSMILNSSTSFCMYSNDDAQFDLTKQIPALHFSITNMVPTPKGDTELTTNWDLQKYMIKNPLKFPIYNKIVFKPNDAGIKRNELNTWAGFKAQEVNDIDMDIVKFFTNHIRDVWANGNEAYYNYLISWLAQVIKHPEKKTDVAILLQGGQGSGKTLPCDILLERVFGKNIGMSSSGLGCLTQRFNGSTMGKIFCKVDELSVVDGDSFNACFDKMKSLITDRHIQIEKKGLEHMMIENHINFIMTTNHRHTVKIEGDDRRYACFEVSDKHKQDNDYFAHFMDMLDNDEAGNHIYTYFKNYPKEDMVNLRKIPMTEIKQEMLDLSKSSVQRFVECMNDELDEACLYDWVCKAGEKAISAINFYENYKGWCSNNGEKAWSNKAVGTELKNKNLYKEKGENRQNGSRRNYYQF